MAVGATLRACMAQSLAHVPAEDDSYSALPIMSRWHMGEQCPHDDGWLLNFAFEISVALSK